MARMPAAPEGWRSTLKLDPDVEDCGKRMADAINIHITFGNVFELRTKFMAISLADGRSDGVLYDSKKDAVRHQIHEQQCYYVGFRNLNPGGVSAYECAVMLQFQRDAYGAGFRLADPDDVNGGQQALMTAGQFDYYRGRSPRPRIF